MFYISVFAVLFTINFSKPTNNYLNYSILKEKTSKSSIPSKDFQNRKFEYVSISFFN